MGFNFDVSAATNILKVRYTRKKIETLAFKSSLLGIFPKDTNYGGQNYTGAIRTAVSSAVSHSDTVAFAQGNASQYQQWQCSWKFGYASANITGAAIDQAKGDANALVDSMVSEFDGAFIGLGQQLGADLFANGGGAFGQISASSNVATATITLADPSKIFNFFNGQILQVASDDGTGGAGVRSGTVTVLAVDINTGNITATGNWSSGISAVVAGDYIFMNGNYNGAFPGLAGWIPPDNQRSGLATTFNNVNRSLDPVRLAGVAYSGGGAAKSETMTKASALVQRMNGRPDYLICNPLDYADLETELGSRVQYMNAESFENAQISFRGINLATAYGHIKILSDVFCPLGYAWLLEMDTWLMPSMEEVPHVAGEGIDGLQWLRSGTADSYQMRALYRATTYCSAPGKNAAIRW